jgi:hypothetical protein
MFVNFFDKLVINTEEIESVEIDEFRKEYFEVIIFKKNSETKTIYVAGKTEFKTEKDLYNHVVKLLNKGIKLNRKISKEVFEQIKDIKELIKDAKSY